MTFKGNVFIRFEILNIIHNDIIIIPCILLNIKIEENIEKI